MDQHLGFVTEIPQLKLPSALTMHNWIDLDVCHHQLQPFSAFHAALGWGRTSMPGLQSKNPEKATKSPPNGKTFKRRCGQRKETHDQVGELSNISLRRNCVGAGGNALQTNPDTRMLLALVRVAQLARPREFPDALFALPDFFRQLLGGLSRRIAPLC